MTISRNKNPYRLARRAGKQGARCTVVQQAVLDKCATGQKTDCTFEKEKHLLRCKQPVLLSSFNVRTLNSEAKMGEITSCAEKEGIDVLCIQEHRIFHEEIAIRHHKMGKGWMLLTSSAGKGSNNATIRGVSILLSPKIYQALNKIESINARTLIASFNGNPSTTVICCYSPTNTSDENDVKEFYYDLAELVEAIPKHNLITIGGDFNAKIGYAESNNRSFHLDTNRNGQHLLDFTTECGLNVQYTKRKGKLWTFTYPNGIKAQLDYILVNKKGKNSALNCEAYNSFTSVNSDHRIVSAKIRLSLRVHKNKGRKKVNYNWNQLLSDNNIKSDYSVDVKNRFEALQADGNDENNADTTYNNIMAAHNEAAKMYIPKKEKKKHHVPWENENIQLKQQAVKEAQKAMAKRETKSTTLRLKNAKDDLDNAYMQELSTYINGKIDIISSATENQQSRLAWETVNEITGRKNTPTGKIKADNPEERLKKWKDHFENLLGQPPVISEQEIIRLVEGTLPINTEDFTKEELLKCIKSFKKGKAAGLDDIPVEVWKTEALIEPLLDVCNMTFHGDKPKIWGKSGLKPLPKKGDLGDTGNYRGISLTVIASKIYNKMLLQRIRPHLEPILRMNQNGFRPNRSTLAQILTLRRLVEGIKSKNIPAVITFVDFSKAFDSIHSGKLMEIMEAYGIPPQIIKAVNTLYKETEAQVLSPDGDTEFFQIQAGVLQGDTLAPLLFILALDYAMKKATTNPQDRC